MQPDVATGLNSLHAGSVGGEQAGTHEKLAQIAAKFRDAGLMLFSVGSGGEVIFADDKAGAFFHKFFLPQLGMAPQWFEAQPAQLITFSGVKAVRLNTQQLGIEQSLFVAARTPVCDEEFQKVCQSINTDAHWLYALAEALPAYGNDALSRQAKLIEVALKDQAEMAGLQSRVKQLSSQLSSTYSELSLLNQVSSGMRVNRRAGDFFRQACDDVRPVIGAEIVGVTLLGTGGMFDTFACGSALPQHESLQQLGGHLLYLMRESNPHFLLTTPEKDSVLKNLAPRVGQILAVPIRRQEELMGCLFALDKPTGQFSDEDARLLIRIADESAVYLENAVLFQDVSGLLMGLLHAMTSAVDAKDPYTCGHSQRVARISQLIASRLDTAVDPQRVYIGGLLHDVGKIGISETILHKTGSLTPEEFDQMKRHPAIGAKILADIRQIQDIIPAVLHHHERYDGRGYPHGLVGQNIPLMGRIVGLADSLDAMTSDRTYRKGMPLSVALAEVRRCAGTHFDPRIAEVALSLAKPLAGILAQGAVLTEAPPATRAA